MQWFESPGCLSILISCQYVSQVYVRGIVGIPYNDYQGRIPTSEGPEGSRWSICKAICRHMHDIRPVLIKVRGPGAPWPPWFLAYDYSGTSV